MTMPHYVVKAHRPLQWSIAIVLLSMIIAFLTWIMLDKSHWTAIYSRLSSNKDSKLLWDVNRSLGKENIMLRERVLMLEQTEELDKQTAVILQDELKSMQNEIFRVKRELEFYQGVMESTRDTKGLNIHGIHIDSLPGTQNYRLKLILTHVTKSDRVAEGILDVVVEGKRNGVAQQLPIIDITTDDSMEFKFKFRNFKKLESDFTLPSGFEPQRVSVVLQPKGKNQSKIKRVFDWPISDS